MPTHPTRGAAPKHLVTPIPTQTQEPPTSSTTQTQHQRRSKGNSKKELNQRWGTTQHQHRDGDTAENGLGVLDF